MCPNCLREINLEIDVYRKETEIENDIKIDLYCKKCHNIIKWKE